MCGPIDDQKPNLPQAKPVRMRVGRASKVLGMPLSDAQCLSALSALGFQCTLSQGEITVGVPSHRFDLQIEEDIIEEVARMVGFDQLPTTPPQASIFAKQRVQSRRSEHALRRSMAALGYQETINFSFVPAAWESDLADNADPVRLLNPIASNMDVMRSSLLGSLLQVLKFNLDRRADRVRVFEIGRVFRKNTSVSATDLTVAGIDQPMHIAAMAYGPNFPAQWGVTESALDFFDVKADLQALLSPLQAEFHAAEHPALHPGRCAAVSLRGRLIGHVGELHPRHRQTWGLTQVPICFELQLDPVLMLDAFAFRPVSKFPFVQRDVAIIVEQQVTHQQLMQAVMATPTKGLLQEAVLFDVYRPENDTAVMNSAEKSLAVRLILSSDEATLTEEQIQGVVDAVLTSLAHELNARLR
ncbi:MAG: phenylalanine--tRNA ligase subunit beta [Betaproteobacteria bacterium]|nr:phenylalanine--tRNA ligase subunit beta [Betaproteobacteria bacterium]